MSSALRRSTAARYLVVGVAAFALDVGMLALLHDSVGLPVWLATGVSFLLSFFFTYFLQRRAFRTRVGHGGALARYIALVGLNTVATSVIVQALSASAIGWLGGKVVATCVTTLWNFFAYRFWVFPAASSGAGATNR